MPEYDATRGPKPVVVKLGPYQFGTVERPEEAILAAENSRLRSELSDALNRLARLRAGGRA